MLKQALFISNLLFLECSQYRVNDMYCESLEKLLQVKEMYGIHLNKGIVSVVTHSSWLIMFIVINSSWSCFLLLTNDVNRF